MVPNYMDALPQDLTANVGKLAGKDDTVYVPGHGSLANHEEFEQYHEFLKSMERTVRASFDKGLSVDEAIAQFTMPEPYAGYYIFSPQVIPRLVTAWYQAFQA